jgi:hypothetical protein
MSASSHLGLWLTLAFRLNKLRRVDKLIQKFAKNLQRHSLLDRY